MNSIIILYDCYVIKFASKRRRVSAVLYCVRLYLHTSHQHVVSVQSVCFYQMVRSEMRVRHAPKDRSLSAHGGWKDRAKRQADTREYRPQTSSRFPPKPVLPVRMRHRTRRVKTPGWRRRRKRKRRRHRIECRRVRLLRGLLRREELCQWRQAHCQGKVWRVDTVRWRGLGGHRRWLCRNDRCPWWETTATLRSRRRPDRRRRG